MKDAAVYRFAIEGSFDQISKHNDKNDQKDVDIILGALSPDWDGVDVWHYNIAALSLKLLNIFLDVIVTGSSWTSFWMLLSRAPPQTETALMYDAVQLFATALNELDQSQVNTILY